MARVLVLFAHPALSRSRVHRALLGAAGGLTSVTVQDLYEEYPDFDVDVAREQALLAAHDTVVLQHPLYWYSVPPLLKQWVDLALTHGWAYGSGGTALRGKALACAVSAGGGAAGYRGDGLHGRTVAEFLAPIEATARLCGMRYLEPFVVHGTHAMEAPEIAAAADAYRAFLSDLAQGEPR